ncbi:MAG TPA: LPXTG cell wall anchor domain-containing protein [Candidatus Paceibacterota bacterium]
MTKKILSLTLLSLFVLFSFAFTAGTASAQTATFPAGCSSALGYSVTTGLPCNGTSTATIGFIAGCTTALGYSITTGVPCSGGPIAINYLAGCSSIFGYSVITGAPCNGTNVATIDPGTVTPTPTPGLPQTGASDNALVNIALLISSAALAAAGTLYVVRNRRAE